jgi:high-affinity nickel-transport protein
MNEALPTIELALLLGLRHGLAPDHLAAIDGLTMRAQPASAPWMGALFALGHGLTVLLIVALADLASAWLQPDSSFLQAMEWLEWLPGILLLALAALNARTLLRPMHARSGNPIGARLLAPLTAVRPLTAFGIGMLFALGVESILQSLAWGYAATRLGGGSWSALPVAGAFVLGMALTDALDGYATARIARTAGQQAMRQFRRRIAWPIIVLCIVSGVQLLLSKVCAACAVAEDGLAWLGVGMVALTLAQYAVAWTRGARPAMH